MFQGFYQLSTGRKSIIVAGLGFSPLIGAGLAPLAWFPHHGGLTVFLSALAMLLFAVVLLLPVLAQLAAHSPTRVAGPEMVREEDGSSHDSAADVPRASIEAARELVESDPQRAAHILRQWIAGNV